MVLQRYFMMMMLMIVINSATLKCNLYCNLNVKSTDPKNKAAKLILDRPLYSSASDGLTIPKWVSLEKRRYQRRCILVYKCLNGLVDHNMDLLRHDDQHNYNTRKKDKLRLPSAKRQWGQQRTAYLGIAHHFITPRHPPAN